MGALMRYGDAPTDEVAAGLALGDAHRAQRRPGTSRPGTALGVAARLGLWLMTTRAVLGYGDIAASFAGA